MHAIPEKLNALRQQMEATMIRRLHDQREELEKKLVDSTNAAEENALKRAEKYLQPLMAEMENKLQARLHTVQTTADQALPRIAEVLERYEALKNEVAPLHSRADASAARLDRLGVQSATTSKDCTSLNQDFQDSVRELRAILVEQDKKRDSLDQALRSMISDKSTSLAASTQALSDRADDQHRQQTSALETAEDRIRRTMKELEERGRREANIGDEGVASKLMPEIQSVEALVKQKSEDCNAQAETLIQATVAKLREELDAAKKACILTSDQQVDRKARELILAMENGLSQANRLTESVRETCDSALRDQVVSVRGWTADGFSEASTNLEKLRQQVGSVEQRCMQAAELAKCSALDGAGQKLDETVKALRTDIEANMQTCRQQDDSVRQDMGKLVLTESTRLEGCVGEMGGKCNTFAEEKVRLTSAQFHQMLTLAITEAHEHADAAQLSAAEALKQEVEARHAAFSASDTARDTVSKNIREELKAAFEDAESRLKSTAAASDDRTDRANAAIKSLEHSLQAAVKEHSESATSMRSQLKAERQQTEEHEADLTKKLAAVRDQLESRITLEAGDIRKSVGESRKRLHDESTDIRAELREKASKQEVAEVSKVSAQRCDGVNEATEGQRKRLEAAVADFSARYRETHHEANEARLRSQRETIQLGGEVTQLRAACTSLATGVVKALNIVGLLNRETLDGSAPPATDKPKGVEIEELLQWEKAGRSLALRIERQWYKHEVGGSGSMLALVERGAEDINTLRSIFDADTDMQNIAAPGLSTLKGASLALNSTMSTAIPGSAGSMVSEASPFPISPQKPSTAPASSQAPQSVRELRDKRMS